MLTANEMLSKGKASKGKQRIELKKIENENARYASFTKRRTGLFTKACDLATLCGPDIAVLVLSPVGKCYSFGSPSVDEVVYRYMSGSPPSSAGTRSGPTNEVQKLNQELMELSKKLEASAAQQAVLQERLRVAAQAGECKWLENVERLGLEELRRLKESLGQLKSQADKRMNELLRGGGPSSSTTGSSRTALTVTPENMANPFEPITLYPDDSSGEGFGSAGF